MRTINKVVVIGAGSMGHGITQVAATSGQEVKLVDISIELLDRATDRISWSLNKLAEKKVINEPPQRIMSRITGTTDLVQAVKNADLVIEAVPEDMELKTKILSASDREAPPHTIFATNTSGLPISILGKAIKRPDKLIGMHWMNPPVVMKLIEIIKGVDSSKETLQTIIELCREYYRKEVVVVKRDVWNFLAGRSHMGWNLGTAYLYHNNEATAEEIDAMARYSMGLPMGPFELADFTGSNEIRAGGLKSVKILLEKYPDFEPWDAFFKAFEYITEVVSKPRVAKGLTGVKTGKGFYTYPEPGKYRKAEISEKLASRVNPTRAIAIAANTSAWCVTNGVGSIEEVEKCFKLAYGWPKGIFSFIKEYGPENIVKELYRGLEKAPEPVRAIHDPDPLLLNMSS